MSIFSHAQSVISNSVACTFTKLYSCIYIRRVIKEGFFFVIIPLNYSHFIPKNMVIFLSAYVF